MNREQELLSELPISNVLLIAPAGCGKTEALAGRARAVVERGDVVAPRLVLALTFSNKAKENLAQRMRAVVGAGWRQRVVVTNLHGLAARVYRAHGAVLGAEPDAHFPEEPWRRRTRAELGITYRNGDEFEEALRIAKAGPYNDEEVMRRLTEIGHQAAIDYELRLRSENRLDHDDLIRHAACLLARPEIRRLYQAHFGMTLVDEVQDLSLMQFEIARAVGGDSVTYAGDPAQGIYSFAGADPDEVFSRIYALSPKIVEFTRSYRSSPAVLRAVNALGAEMGTSHLECADPARWADEGKVVSIERESREDEARALLAMVQRLTRDQNTTVAIVGRRGTRADRLRNAAQQAGIAFEDWAMPSHVGAVADLLNRCLPDARRGRQPEGGQLEQLGVLCRELIDDADVETHDALAGALDHLGQLVRDGMSVSEAVQSCRVSSAPGAPVAPGLHVLTGHKGKGQEFDWVFVVGLEDGQVPDFRSHTDASRAEELRVLHVMVSRARYGLVVTFVRTDGWRSTAPSPWLSTLRAVATHVSHV